MMLRDGLGFQNQNTLPGDTQSKEKMPNQGIKNVL